MSLQTDRIFYEALKADDELLTAIGSRLYNTAIPLPDEDADNVPVPFIIITYDGMTNDGATKDSFEGDTDTVRISVEVTATTRDELAELTEMVRTDISTYMSTYTYDDSDEDDLSELVPYDYQLTADAVQYDSSKPCFWQVLTYQCDTNT